MRTHAIGVWTLLTLAVMGCTLTGTGIDAPIGNAQTIAANTATACPETMPAIQLGQADVNSQAIANNCRTEACSAWPKQTVTGGMWWALSGPDEIDITCPDGRVVRWSLHSCWDCAEGCAAKGQCPPGTLCQAIAGDPVTGLNHGIPGSDCQIFACENPTDYHLVDDPAQGAPAYCARRPDRPCLSAAVPLSMELLGPTTISGTCSWTIQPRGGSGNYAFTWIKGSTVVGNKRYWTGRHDAVFSRPFYLTGQLHDVNTGQVVQAQIIVAQKISRDAPCG